MNLRGRPPVAPATRFWVMVNRTDTCWLWTGVLNKGGYGSFRPDPKRPTIPAHVWAYVQANGPIPKGMVLDHQCHDPKVCHLGNKCPHRHCVNPAHMIPVLSGTNTSRDRQSSNEARKTHCPHDHPYDDQNTYFTPAGKRQCRTCRNEWQRRFKAKRRAANLAGLMAQN